MTFLAESSTGRRALLGLLCWISVSAAAHTPHDVINAFSVVPGDGQPDTLIAVVSGNLLVRSVDGGASWHDLNRGLDNRFAFTSVASAKKGPQVLALVATDGDGAYRSTDGGGSWQNVNGGLSDHRLKEIRLSSSADIAMAVSAAGRLYVSKDVGGRWTRTATTTEGITTADICADSSGRQELLLGTRDGRVQISRDSGEHWLPLAELPGDDAVTSLACDYSDPEDPTYLIGRETQGLYRVGSDPRPASMIAAFPGSQVQDIAVLTRKTRPTAYLVSTWRDGVFVSEDLGTSWLEFSTGLTSDQQADRDPLHLSPHFRHLEIGSTQDDGQRLYLGAFTGLFTTLFPSSQPANGQWQALETLALKRIIAMTASPPTESGFDLAMTTYGGGAYLLADTDQRMQVMNTALPNPRLTDIVFSPNYPADERIFSAVNGALLFWRKSNQRWDGLSLRPGGLSEFKRRGLGFLHHRIGLPQRYSTDFLTAWDLLFPYPETIVPSPRFNEDATLFLTTRRDGLIAYDLQSQSISQPFNSDRLVRDVEIVGSSNGADSIFAAMQATGVFRSTDGGATWSLANRGLTAINTWQALIDSGWGKQANNLGYFAIRLLAAQSTETDPPVLFAVTGAGLFRSIDGATSWSAVRISEQGHREIVLTAALSPHFSDDGFLLISLKGRGLFASRDHGRTFQSFAPDLIREHGDIAHLAFSPRFSSDATLYAATEQNLYRSTDAGNSWQITPRLVRYENDRDVIEYSGEWQQQPYANASGNSIHASTSAASRSTLRFVGTGIRVIGTSSAKNTYDIMLDQQLLDTHHAQRDEGVLAQVSDLPYGPHTISVVVRSDVNIDAFDILGVEFQSYNRSGQKQQ